MGCFVAEDKGSFLSVLAYLLGMRYGRARVSSFASLLTYFLPSPPELGVRSRDLHIHILFGSQRCIFTWRMSTTISGCISRMLEGIIAAVHSVATGEQ